jgi:FAD/FMN-containing dehydrogenase/ferredoxin
MSTGSYLESHIGISPDGFPELAPEARSTRVRERIGELHGFVDDGRPVETRAVPARARERALGLREAVRQAAGEGTTAAATLDSRLLTDRFLRQEYSRDQNVYLGGLFTRRLTEATPDVVFLPTSTAETAAALRWSRAARVPLTLRGAGTTAMGGSVPSDAGVVLELSRLDGVEIDVAEGVVVMGAGARLRPVHEALAARGLALRVYPSNLGGTFAGWFATGGIGLNAFGPGRARDAVRWAEAVLPNGDAVRLRRGGEIEVEIGANGQGRWLTGDAARAWFAQRGSAAVTLEDCAGSEGQFGALTRLAVEVGERPELICFLLEFADSAAAFDCADWIRKWAGRAFPMPANLKWLSASHLGHARRARADDDARAWRAAPSELSGGAGMPWARLLGPDEYGWDAGTPGAAGEPAAAYLFVDFLDRAAGEAFSNLLGKAPGAPRVLVEESARFGAERFRPQALKRFGPGLLAAEVLLPAARAAEFVRAAHGLAHGAGVELDCEIYYLADGAALVLAAYLTDHRRGGFLVDLALTPALFDLAIERCEGRPYVLGRWASGFFARAVGMERARGLQELKQGLDPDWTLGRGAFFGGGFRGPLGALARRGWGPGIRLLRGLLGTAWTRPPVRAARRLMSAWPGALAAANATAAEAPVRPDGAFAPATAAARAGTCVNCGECNSVCPIFRDSAVRLPQMLTHLAEGVAAGGEPGRTGATLLDLCLRCGNCEEVCQAGIPHLPLYEAMQAAADAARPRERERHLAVLGAVRGSEAYARAFLKIRPGGYLKRTPAALPGLVRFVVQRTEEDAGAAATCIHCAACVPVCPTQANLEFEQEDPRLITTDQARCIGCGTCVEVCPANLANGGRTLRVMEAPTLEWVTLVREALAAGGEAGAAGAAAESRVEELVR